MTEPLPDDYDVFDVDDYYEAWGSWAEQVYVDPAEKEDPV